MMAFKQACKFEGNKINITISILANITFFMISACTCAYQCLNKFVFFVRKTNNVLRNLNYIPFWSITLKCWRVGFHSWFWHTPGGDESCEFRYCVKLSLPGVSTCNLFWLNLMFTLYIVPYLCGMPNLFLWHLGGSPVLIFISKILLLLAFSYF